MFSKAEIQDELNFIETEFEFSDDCPIELRNHILSNGLAYYYDGTLMLSNTGELAIGYDKEDLGDEEEDITEAFFHDDFNGYDDGSEDEYK